MAKFFLFVILCFSISSTAIAAEDPNQAIHDSLRTTVSGIEQAINEERYSDISEYFHKTMQVTTINQEVISKPEEISDYFNRWFGSGGFLKKLEIKLTPDALTEFYNDNSFGVVRGSGMEDYILADDRTYRMMTRWTATVMPDENGKWLILSLHIGTNFLDNPILDEAKGSLMYFAIGGVLLGGLLTGLMIFVARRLKAKP